MSGSLKLNYPNALTGIRLILTFAFLYLVSTGRVSLAAAVFLPAWVLDAFDGWVARTWHQESRFGYYFDKTVDRILIVGGVLALLIWAKVSPAAIFILTKDGAMGIAATIQLGSHEPVDGAGRLGKFAVLVQGFALLWLLLELPYEAVAIFTAALVGAVSGGVYLHRVAYRK